MLQTGEVLPFGDAVAVRCPSIARFVLPIRHRGNCPKKWVQGASAEYFRKTQPTTSAGFHYALLRNLFPFLRHSDCEIAGKWADRSCRLELPAGEGDRGNFYQ
jgi:hypothetical protein